LRVDEAVPLQFRKRLLKCIGIDRRLRRHIRTAGSFEPAGYAPETMSNRSCSFICR
jgi:hypothetical protein